MKKEWQRQRKRERIESKRGERKKERVPRKRGKYKRKIIREIRKRAREGPPSQLTRE